MAFVTPIEGPKIPEIGMRENSHVRELMCLLLSDQLTDADLCLRLLDHLTEEPAVSADETPVLATALSSLRQVEIFRRAGALTPEECSRLSMRLFGSFESRVNALRAQARTSNVGG